MISPTASWTRSAAGAADDGTRQHPFRRHHHRVPGPLQRTSQKDCPSHHRRRRCTGGGGVQVAAPVDTTAYELQSLVRRRAPWILNHAADGLLAVAPKRFVSGETLPYLGRNVRMVFEPVDARSVEVRFDHWRFNIRAPQDLHGEQRYQRVRKAIIAWYRRRAGVRLQAGVKKWLPRFGVRELPDVLIRDQRQRWGSCAPDGTLRFNWRVVMLEPALNQSQSGMCIC